MNNYVYSKSVEFKKRAYHEYVLNNDQSLLNELGFEMNDNLVSEDDRYACLKNIVKERLETFERLRRLKDLSNLPNKDKLSFSIVGVDLIDRGYSGVIVQDFLTYHPELLYDVVITNPPFSLAQEFIEHSMECVKDGGQICMFLKIQFLEGAKRKELYEKYPPKYVYVFRNRMSTWMNGSQVDENGKKWSTTMCHAWFVWEKGSTTEPIIRWL